MTERSTVLHGHVHLHCDARKRPPHASHACCSVHAEEAAATSERRTMSTDACRGRIACVAKRVNTLVFKALGAHEIRYGSKNDADI